MLFYEPGHRDRDLLAHDPFKAIVAPRPIGWTSTQAADGRINLAPYSFFNAVGEAPPMLAFSSLGAKDSVTFVLASPPRGGGPSDYAVVQSLLQMIRPG